MISHSAPQPATPLAPTQRPIARRALLKQAALAASSAIPLASGCATLTTDADDRKKKPNIIFILADDLGYGDLGCYGQQRIQTPNIDRLAQQGLKFTDHYAGSTVCAPSRCCLMTGLHSGHALVRGNARVPLTPEDTTVAEILKDAGYNTALIGKWGLGEPDTTGVPNNQGFDYFFGYLNQRHAHNYYPDYLWRNREKVPLKNIVRDVNPPGGVATEKIEYSHDLFAEEALRFVEKNRSNAFFLYLALTIPHANNEAGKKGMEVPSLEPYAEKNWPDPQKGHAAMITRMDGDIGRLMKKIKDLGIDNNTIVFFSSDNGPHKEGGADPEFFKSSGPLKGYKRALYEGGIRVPLIVRWPGKIKPASITAHVSAFWDFLPTCCELAGVTCPYNIDGISFAPTLLGRNRQQKTHEYLYWEFHEQGKKQAVRMGPWKAVRLNAAKNPDAPVELYNLDDDIAETKNLADSRPQIARKLQDLIDSARIPSKEWPWPGD